jgi:hypothetical protein
MITSYLFCIFILTTSVNGQVQLCGKNEQFTNCASSSCFEESCQDVLFAKPMLKKCTRDCKSGCQCKPGYYRRDKRCVDELTCVMCGYQEDWLVHDRYEATCNDFRKPSDVYNVIQTDNVTHIGNITHTDNATELLNVGGGCYCAEDHYRTVDGLCVTGEACEQCRANEVFEQCGSSRCWEYTCEDVNIPLRERLMRPCTTDCIMGCKCHPGFYRNTTNGKCVSALMCV